MTAAARLTVWPSTREVLLQAEMIMTGGGWRWDRADGAWMVARLLRRRYGGRARQVVVGLVGGGTIVAGGTR